MDFGTKSSLFINLVCQTRSFPLLINLYSNEEVLPPQQFLQ